jgi:broad specificity phosphatase PhoE
MAETRILYVVRHGQTEWNAWGRMQGRLDSPLTALGRRQAEGHGQTLRSLGGVDAVVVSPLGRTRETAALVNAHLSAPLRYEDALMERDCGEWSGLTMDEIAARYPDSWRVRSEDPYHHRPPGGENLEDMRERVRACLGDLLGGSARRLAVVTHGVMSRVIMQQVLDLTPELTATVRHPNELFYRLELRADGVRASHFLAGEGPLDGLLHHTD